MKITPINFTKYLEPELVQYWEGHRFAKGKKIQIQRTHNLRLSQTLLNAVAKSRDGDSVLLSSIQLVQIPQQEANPAINGLIHLPHLDKPTQLLMVFKTESDPERWSQKIVEKLRVLMISAPDASDPKPPPVSETTTPGKAEEDSEDTEIK